MIAKSSDVKFNPLTQTFPWKKRWNRDTLLAPGKIRNYLKNIFELEKCSYKSIYFPILHIYLTKYILRENDFYFACNQV